MNKNKCISIMGVANVTPNSFSDGSKYNNSLLLKEHILSLIDNGATIIDIGAESTAPFNSAITSDMERERFAETIIPVIQEILPELKEKSIKISIDSYRYETVMYFYNIFAGEISIIWNDVSGKIDESVLKFLQETKMTEYIYCHNLAPKRDLTSEHMSYLHSGDITSHFQDWIREFLNLNIDLEKIYLDPCFGFSKTYEQNFILMDSLIDDFKLYERWVIGISKKSFLRKKLIDSGEVGSDLSKEELLNASEKLHKSYIDKCSKAFVGSSLVFRVHNPEIIS